MCLHIHRDWYLTCSLRVSQKQRRVLLYMKGQSFPGFLRPCRYETRGTPAQSNGARLLFTGFLTPFPANPSISDCSPTVQIVGWCRQLIKAGVLNGSDQSRKLMTERMFENFRERLHMVQQDFTTGLVCFSDSVFASVCSLGQPSLYDYITCMWYLDLMILVWHSTAGIWSAAIVANYRQTASFGSVVCSW